MELYKGILINHTNCSFQYSITGGANYQSSNIFTSDLVAGTYTVIVRDSKFCKLIPKVLLVQPDVLANHNQPNN
jgi:hypothetical protein